MSKLNDYNITLHLRCENNPRKWIVDHFYDNLNTKFGEDILYWDVKDIKETNNKSSKSSKQTNNKEDTK
tara:strand:- start:158 stop:364 length:207 start_codon:yes stop_codon:yes gene_type:complete